jgi:competence protein ComEA
MNLYSGRQLVVILTILAGLFLFSALRAVSEKFENGFDRNNKTEFAYELRGNIRKGGFYFFNKEQTVEELISAGGGLKNNMAFPLDVYGKVKTGSRIFFSEHVKIGKIGASARLNFFMPISVNSSSIEELIMLPGVGVKTAESIVKYRESNNGIKNLGELTSIHGIGKKKIEAIVPYLTTED